MLWKKSLPLAMMRSLRSVAIMVPPENMGLLKKFNGPVQYSQQAGEFKFT
jgi:hypothetical protein